MIDSLSPEQAYELQLYYSVESFGEMRNDLRMANMLRFYYDIKRGKKGKKLSLGELTLYPDLIESSGTQDLKAFLAGVAESSRRV
jgi:hypothetical protein